MGRGMHKELFVNWTSLTKQRYAYLLLYAGDSNVHDVYNGHYLSNNQHLQQLDVHLGSNNAYNFHPYDN